MTAAIRNAGADRDDGHVRSTARYPWRAAMPPRRRPDDRLIHQIPGGAMSAARFMAGMMMAKIAAMPIMRRRARSHQTIARQAWRFRCIEIHRSEDDSGGINRRLSRTAFYLRAARE